MLTGRPAGRKADFPLVTTGPGADFFPAVTDHAEIARDMGVTDVMGKNVHLARRACLLLAVAGLAALPLTAAQAADTVTTPAAPPALGAGGFPWLASLSPAAGPASYDLSSGQVAVRAGGRTWELSVQLSKFTSAVPGFAEVQIETPYRGGEEEHGWTFGVFPGRDMRVGARGSASVASGSALSPIASMRLAFKPSSHKVASCLGGGSQTTYSGRLTGSVRLATGLHRLSLSASKVTFGQPSTLSVTSDSCVPRPCSLASWEALSNTALRLPFTIANGAQVGRPGHSQYYAGVAKATQLSKARQVLRADGAVIKTADPVFSKSRRTLRVTTSKDGAVTGSAVIGPAGDVTPERFVCTAGGTPFTESSVSYDGRYASPAGHQLTAHTLLTGTLKIARKGTGGFDIIKIGRAHV